MKFADISNPEERKKLIWAIVLGLFAIVFLWWTLFGFGSNPKPTVKRTNTNSGPGPAPRRVGETVSGPIRQGNQERSPGAVTANRLLRFRPRSTGSKTEYFRLLREAATAAQVRNSADSDTNTGSAAAFGGNAAFQRVRANRGLHNGS